MFEQTIPGTPLFVESMNGNDYYAVPFNLPVLSKKTPISSSSSLPFINKYRTMVVVLIDAEDGHFKEISWTKNPVKYLPISRSEALDIIYKYLEEIGIYLDDTDEIKIELVYRESTPYYPDWCISIKDMIYFVSQDGVINYEI